MGIGNIANTGLKASMKNMDTISNNIANANTVGFRKSKVTFADIYAGGMTSSGSGLGVQVVSSTQDFSSAGTQNTGRALDLSIRNDAFFVVKKQSSGQTSYTRNGQFDIDNSGYLTGLNGRLQGYSATKGVLNSNGALADLQISNNPIPASPTAKNALMLNLNAASVVPTSSFDVTDPTSYNYRTDTPFYDSLGNASTLSVYYTLSSNNNWTTNVSIDGTAIGSGSLVFNSDGQLASTTGMDKSSLSWSPSNGATAPQAFEIDLTGSTQFTSNNEIFSTSQDGYTSASLTGYYIDNSGIINMQYSNGVSQIGGQVALAQFISPQGLIKNDNMTWLASTESGDPIIKSNTSIGAISSGSLDSSNVDLTEELVNLISTQNNFQANAKVLSTGNDVLKNIIQI